MVASVAVEVTCIPLVWVLVTLNVVASMSDGVIEVTVVEAITVVV